MYNPPKDDKDLKDSKDLKDKKDVPPAKKDDKDLKDSKDAKDKKDKDKKGKDDKAKKGEYPVTLEKLSALSTHSRASMMAVVGRIRCSG